MLRKNKSAHKNDFGHVLILAGSARMLGAGCLASLAAMRAGAGLCTLGVPKSLNTAAQKKCANMIMTWPLAETQSQSFASTAFAGVKRNFHKFQCIAIGPGTGTGPSTASFVRKVIAQSTVPLVIDADALNIIAENPAILLKSRTPKILTPHPGEMARLTGKTKKYVDTHREAVAKNFAEKFKCVLLLKGRNTLVAGPVTGTVPERGLSPLVPSVSPSGIYINKTGNVGMATAGAGDVLTGIIAAFVAQGVEPFEAAKAGAYLHGLAGDLAVKKMGEASLTAEDILAWIPGAIKRAGKK